jgi:WD40 repeat protein
VVLSELLTGERPFRGSTHMVIAQVVHDEPPPPRRLDQRIPRDLDTICQRAMQKKPSGRYGSAREMAEDVKRFLSGRPVRARRVSRRERLWRWVRRQPLISGLTAAVALSLVGGAGLSTFFAIQAGARAREATQRSYVSNLRLAQRIWGDGRVGRLREILDGQRPERTGGVDLHGFEWYYWHNLCHGALRTLEGRSQVVESIAFGADGRIASTSGREICVWNATYDRPLWTLDGIWGRQVLFSCDGRRLIALAPEGARVLDANNGQAVASVGEPTSSDSRVAVSPDGRYLALSMGQEARLWHIGQGRKLAVFKGHTDLVKDLAFSPDGKRLASASDDRSVRIWRVQDGGQVHLLEGHTDHVTAVAFSPDGLRLASGGADRTIRLWSAATGRPTAMLKGHNHTISSLAFSLDGRWLVSGGLDQTVRLWDVATGQEIRKFLGHTHEVSSVASAETAGGWHQAAGTGRCVSGTGPAIRRCGCSRGIPVKSTP